MLRYIIALIGFLPIVAKSQQIDWKKLQKNSTETFVYKITAAQAEQFIKWDSIPVDIFLSEIPVKIFKTDSVQTDSLAIGQYVLLSIKDNEIEASMVANTNLFIYPVINEQVHIIEVRDVDGNYINNALVWVDGKKTKVLKNSGNYQLKQKKLPKESFIKVFTENDTAFLSFEKDDSYYSRNNQSVFKQKLNYWKNKPLIRNIVRIPLKYGNGLMYLVTKKYKYQRNFKYTYGKRRKYKNGSIGAKGYMVFNQPKYKLTDTVKLKAYIIDKKEKQYNKPVAVYLSYYARNKYNNQLLTILNPSSKGSYIYEFPLHDSLYNDVTYGLSIKTKNGKQLILNGSFKTEDYVLDEVATFNFRSEKQTYYKQDSLVFYASAKDANNLPLLDAKAKFYLLPQSVKSYQADSIYIPDTLFFQQKKLEAEGDTKFSIAAKDLPKASLLLKAKIEFINSNNEIQEKYVSVNYEETNKEIRAKIVADTVYAEYFEDGISKKAFGELDVENDKGFENTLKITYPYKGKIEPLTESYDFSVYERDSLIAFESVEQASNYEVDFNRINKNDTAGFTLINPLKIPINYLIFDGNKLVESVKSNEEKINWLKKFTNRKKTFTVKYNYAWQGKQIEKTESIALLYKLLNIEIKGKDKVFPGQKDSLTVEVKDYKGNAVNNMNLTALSYNTQFKKDIKVKEPPYLAKYKKTAPLWRRGKYKDDEAEDVYISKKYLLGKHQQWRNKFGVDSMLYYQMLFPDSNGMQIATAKNEFTPEVSIYVVKNGKPEPIYILYLNNQPVYYDITTVKMPYSFYVANSYTKIGFRLLDKYVEIDSYYLQPYYRHKLVFDLDKLPANAKIIAKNDYYDSDESNWIERTTWQLNKNFSNAYVWQNWKVAEIKTPSRSNSYSKHLIGPFYANDSMHYFQKNQFDIHFRFEYGYEYSLSDKILRLEKKNILETTTKSFTTPSYHYYIHQNKNYNWDNLADTIAEQPIIEYKKQENKPKLYLTSFSNLNNFIKAEKSNAGQLSFSTSKDTIIKLIIIKKLSSNDFIVIDNTGSISLPTGEYQLQLITNNLFITKTNFKIKPKTKLYLKTNSCKYSYDKALLDSLSNASYPISQKKEEDDKRETLAKSKDTITSKTFITDTTEMDAMPIIYGKGTLHGVIKDAKGKLPIGYASVMIKHSTKGTSTDVNGKYILKNLKEGKYTITVGAIGYKRAEVEVYVDETSENQKDIFLNPETQNLEEVVVIGYGTAKRKDVTGSIAIVSSKELSLAKQLEGRVAGLNVQSESNGVFADTRIMLMGIRSITGNNQPILIVDGIISDISLINTINPNDIESTEVLKGEDAIAVYGIKAVEGAIIIKTKNPLTLRTKFRDYAFWKPELFTNKHGKVSFEVTYPDNITSWETYVLGMDKKRRMGKAVTITRAFKPVMAQLSLPQFLIEGDEVNIVGKVLNYTQDVYQYQSTFSIQNSITKQTSANVNSSASAIEKLQVKTTFADTLKAKFSIETTTGFKDGEERKIPIFKKGIEETIGNFWSLNNDTTINYTASNDANSIEINAVVNTLDILLKEIDHLKNYPFYCMEQTSSKLKGLLFEKQIKEQLHQPFKADKDIDFLINKLQKAQNFDGSWGWWEGGKANIHITNYVLNSLLLVPQNELIKTNIRNGLLYLENQLPRLNKDELLSTLVTMNNAKHSFDYTNYINKINFDSISLNQQWQYVRIKQQLKKDYSKEVDSLMKKANNGMLGSLSWGTQNYLWYNNHTASTLIAYNVFSNDEKYKKFLPSIIQYFIAERKNGYWANTVESSSILATILPNVLANNTNFSQKTTLEIGGDTSCIVKEFPFNKKLSSNIHQLSFKKNSGGLMYLTAFQKNWNTNPNTVADKFKINTYFSKNGEHTAYLETGGKVTMTVAVEALKDAEYVMIEVPIPAGCLYGNKKNNYYEYREYSKNKVSVFVEKMNTGTHYFTIELEPRYTGTFTLNAAKAELMYFPTFYGRNETKQVEIKE